MFVGSFLILCIKRANLNLWMFSRVRICKKCGLYQAWKVHRLGVACVLLPLLSRLIKEKTTVLVQGGSFYSLCESSADEVWMYKCETTDQQGISILTFLASLIAFFLTKKTSFTIYIWSSSFRCEFSFELLVENVKPSWSKM